MPSYHYMFMYVTSIFKKGAKSIQGNYRPVSLTSLSCKVMGVCDTWCSDHPPSQEQPDQEQAAQVHDGKILYTEPIGVPGSGNNSGGQGGGLRRCLLGFCEGISQGCSSAPDEKDVREMSGDGCPASSQEDARESFSMASSRYGRMFCPVYLKEVYWVLSYSLSLSMK